MDKFKTDVAKAFGQTLRKAREAAGLSQEMLALSSGIDRSFVSMLERGVCHPSLSTVLVLADSLKIAPCELLAGVQFLARKRKVSG